MRAEGCTRLRLAGLRAIGLPVLVYGLQPWGLEAHPWTEGVGVADAAFDLKRIKAKIREMLRGPSTADRLQPAARDALPHQLQFNFTGWKGD